jgi:hypothetical protein
VEDLERDLALHRHLLGEIDARHLTFAERALDAEASGDGLSEARVLVRHGRAW